MKIIYKQGNLLECEEKTIVHGCNAQGKMGAGVAKAIKEKYPNVFKEYEMLCNSYSQSGELPSLLGRCQVIYCSDGKAVINAITQMNYGREKGMLYISYETIKKVFSDINEWGKRGHVKEIAMPKIGAGLAGGDWNIIEKIIEEELTDVQPVVYYL